MLSSQMNIPLNPEALSVKRGQPISLREWKTNTKAVYSSKKHYIELLDEHVAELSDLQRVLYAHGSMPCS